MWAIWGRTPARDSAAAQDENSTCGGLTVSSLPRRAGLVVAVIGAAIGLNLAAPRADAAAPETVVHQSSQQSASLELAKQLRERQQALWMLNQRADARDRALIGRKAVLATYGYTGDPDEVTAVLPLATYRVSAGFGLSGPLWEAEHGGQDFGASAGETIVAVACRRGHRGRLRGALRPAHHRDAHRRHRGLVLPPERRVGLRRSAGRRGRPDRDAWAPPATRPGRTCTSRCAPRAAAPSTRWTGCATRGSRPDVYDVSACASRAASAR